MNENGLLHSLIYDLTDVLYEEHGTGVQYRTTMVGNDYFEKKYGAALRRDTLPATIEATVEAMKQEGLITAASYSTEDFILRLKVSGCLLLPTDRKLLPLHGKIVNCPCANVVMHFIDGVLGRYSEFVKAEIGEDGCELLICVMGQAGE